jgi:hypothetical protein
MRFPGVFSALAAGLLSASLAFADGVAVPGSPLQAGASGAAVGYPPPSGGGGSYIDPCDAVSGCVAFYSCSRAGTAAFAASGGFLCAAVPVTGAHSGVICAFKVLPGGGVGLTADAGGSLTGCTAGSAVGLTMAQFAGTDATATCTIATTTATCTGASSTPHVGDTITGAGLSYPCLASAVGTFTGGAGTVTLTGLGASPCGTIASGETLTFTNALNIRAVYDQIASYILQGTANYPQLVPVCQNSVPCIYFNGSTFAADTNAAPAQIPATFNAVGTYIGAVAGVFIGSTVINNNPLYGFWLGPGGAVQFFNNAGGTGASTLAASTWGVSGGVFTSNASRTAYTNGAAGTTDTTSVTASVVTDVGMSVIYYNGGTPAGYLTGYVGEAAEWGSALTSANMASICHNDYLYWATATSC